ncbi:MAG: GntR family transcriptional regulator [Bacillota bacterium]
MARTRRVVHSPLTTVVADAIRDRIVAGELGPGERLAEERLSEELGVSRMPVREALRALAAEGFVTVRPRHGASVTAYDAHEIGELIEVRATLEGLNARLAARRQNPGQIAELQRVLADGSRCTERSDLAQLQAANARFHEALAAIAGNTVLMNIVRSLRDRTALIFAPASRLRVRENWEEHAGIVRAVINGDAELAALLSERHVYNAAKRTEDLSKAPRPKRRAAPKARLRATRGSGS